MDPQTQQRLSACVEALRPIQEAMGAGEVEWAHALTVTTLVDLRAIHKRVCWPSEAIRAGLIAGLTTKGERPIRGRLGNALIGASMGWLMGQIQNHAILDDIERLIKALTETRLLLEQHIRSRQALPAPTPGLQTQGEADG